MKNGIFASLFLVMLLGMGISVSAHPRRYRVCNHVVREVVRECVPPIVVYDRPGVYITRGYHAYPNCGNRPIVFARECRTTPWYYVREHHAPIEREYECEHAICHRR